MIRLIIAGVIIGTVVFLVVNRSSREEQAPEKQRPETKEGDVLAALSVLKMVSEIKSIINR